MADLERRENQLLDKIADLIRERDALLEQVTHRTPETPVWLEDHED